jgi:hypothetical protein
MSICKFKIFSGGYTPGPPLIKEGKREEGKERDGKERWVGDGGYKTGKRGGMG